LNGPVKRTRFELTGGMLRARSEGDFAGARFEVVAHGGEVHFT
jgi:hypothetical protein